MVLKLENQLEGVKNFFLLQKFTVLLEVLGKDRSRKQDHFYTIGKTLPHFKNIGKSL